jgi:hypothetical protein
MICDLNSFFTSRLDNLMGGIRITVSPSAMIYCKLKANSHQLGVGTVHFN